ncbi:MAG TPA: hypothetical protein DCY13_07435, partial [Verrucomicrobiales bacterium]|nr:hypothetical protein [Verrucomicrobiales bacterium]
MVHQLETGLNYRDAHGKWQIASTTVEIIDSLAVGTRTGHRVTWKANPNQSKVFEFMGANGEYLSGSVVGIAYHDRNSDLTAILAETRDAAGFVEDGVSVSYVSAFDGLEADIRYSQMKAGFEQDVILREKPLPPEIYGMNGDSTFLEVWTEFFDTPDPHISEIPKNLGRGGEASGKDFLLKFGGYSMPLGKAFGIEPNGDPVSGDIAHPVSKQWLVIEGRRFLVESVPYRQVHSS